MVLQVNNATKEYKSNRGAIDISFDIKEGEIFGLLGPNGSGKTTLMKMVTGLIKPQKGIIKIFGYDIVENTNNALMDVGALIEMQSSLSFLTAYDNLKLVSDFYKNPLDILELLDLVGLIKVKNEKVSKFSLGMKQRMGIALALVGNPKMLVLDEPTNGLDIEATVNIRNMVIDFSKEKKASVLISSHLAHELELTCSKVGVMQESKLIDIESMDNVLENNKSLEAYYLRIVSTFKEGAKQ